MKKTVKVSPIRTLVGKFLGNLKHNIHYIYIRLKCKDLVDSTTLKKRVRIWLTQRL